MRWMCGESQCYGVIRKVAGEQGHSTDRRVPELHLLFFLFFFFLSGVKQTSFFVLPLLFWFACVWLFLKIIFSIWSFISNTFWPPKLSTHALLRMHSGTELMFL